MYKQRLAKQVSNLNTEKRLDYEHDHKDNTVENYWQFIT